MVPPLDVGEEGSKIGFQEESNLNNKSSERIENIDWEKVGRIYKPESAVESIINGEMGRLRKAFEQLADNQDVANEEKFKKKK